MIVLDTNVVSELVRQMPEARVVTWLDGQETSQVHLTAITAADLRHGVARLPEGRRRSELADLIALILEQDFEDRILSFDATAATHYADVVVHRDARGRPISMTDAQIASICRSHVATLATRNVRDFEDVGLALHDPWLSPAD